MRENVTENEWSPGGMDKNGKEWHHNQETKSRPFNGAVFEVKIWDNSLETCNRCLCGAEDLGEWYKSDRQFLKSCVVILIFHWGAQGIQ